MRITIPSCLKMKIRNASVIGSVEIKSTDGSVMYNQYSCSRIGLGCDGKSHLWMKMDFSEEALMFIREEHKPFKAHFVTYHSQPSRCALRRKDVMSILGAKDLRPPTLCETIAIASETIVSGAVRQILISAGCHRAVAAVRINPELPNFYQFGVESDLGSFNKLPYAKDDRDRLRFADRLDPVSFRWPVLIGIEDP